MANGPATTETWHLRTLFALGAAGCLTDGQLLERFATLGGEPAELAFAALVERHGPMVLRVARSASIDESSAHDAFQATFLILARKARSLWVRDSLGPWLHSVAYRVAAQSRSNQARRRRLEHEAARPEAHVNRESDRSDLVRTIHEEIERLPQPYRLAVVTCHLEGLTQHEAAARLGWPVGTLQSRLARGRQRLRDRLRRRGFAPSLGAIVGKLAPVPHALTASTARLAATLYHGRTVAGIIPPAVLAMIETTTKGMLMTKLKLGAVALMMACGLAGSGVGLGLGLGRSVRATDGPPPSLAIEPARPDIAAEILAEPPAVEDKTPEPTMDIAPPPRPWETVVRIKILHDANAWEFGSGAVVQSTEKGTILLTHASLLRKNGSPDPLPPPVNFREPIRVDLFDGKLIGRQPARVGPAEKDLPGELIDYDQATNLALIRIMPGRVLPASKVVSSGWVPVRGMRVYSAGCPNGEDATTWDTVVLDPSLRMWATLGQPTFQAIKCAYEPKPGREGGGLYTVEGDLMGICLSSNLNEHVGYYAPPESIRALLDRNGLAKVHGINVVEIATPSNKGVQRDPLLRSKRIYEPKADWKPATGPAPALGVAPAVPTSVQDRRLDDLERKLDRVLKALEGLKEVDMSDQLKGDFGNFPKKR